LHGQRLLGYVTLSSFHQKATHEETHHAHAIETVPPILIGHSAGGAFVQLLLDRGHGAVGVAINSAPTEGVRVTPLSQLKSSFPVLKNPANRHRAVALTYDEWRYTFTNTFDEVDARAAYDRYHVPASGGIFWDSVLANFIPGPQDVAVDYHNEARPPLLFISGSEVPDAARGSTLEREALQVEHDHGNQGIPGTLASHARATGVGGDRRLCTGLGRGARCAPAADRSVLMS
jgi:hypothetical protein